jgi:hypothetical protein
MPNFVYIELEKRGKVAPNMNRRIAMPAISEAEYRV